MYDNRINACVPTRSRDSAELKQVSEEEIRKRELERVRERERRRERVEEKS
jgi:hypothetical protein